MHNKIFISYAKEDIAFAEKLYIFLEENNFCPWLDKKDLLPGQDWNFTIRKALKEADYIIALLSNNSVQKRSYVQREFKLALDYYEEKLDDDIYFIPFRINNCDIPPMLSKFQWIDFNENDSFHKILRSLNLQRKKLLSYKHENNQTTNLENLYSKKVFKIELSKEFECKQSDIILADYFTQIKDLHKEGKLYEIEFEIENITDIYNKHEKLKEIQNPSEENLNLKLQYRSYLDSVFFFENETLYDKLKNVIENIIFYSHNKYYNLNSIKDAVTSIKYSLRHFSSIPLPRNGKGFDVFYDKNNWIFKIYLNDDEILELLKSLDLKNPIISENFVLLSRFGGFYVTDLQNETIIREVIPKLAYAYSYKNISSDKKDEYFKISNWQIGLA